METKNIEAMGRGREYMLARFANLPIPWSTTMKIIQSPSADLETAKKAVSEFRNKFGELAPGIAGDADWYARIATFRYYWHWRQAPHEPRHRRPLLLSPKLRADSRRLSINEMDDASAWATGILSRNTLGIEVDFASGRINVTPETLLDWLVLSMIQCRRNLAMCANESCKNPHFVKTYPRSLYCSIECSAMGRQAGQRTWEKENRSAASKRFGKRKKG